MEKEGSSVVVTVQLHESTQAKKVVSLYRDDLAHESTIGAVLNIDECGQTTVTPLHKETRLRYSFDSELTFTPKLNETSLKLAKHRGQRWRESYDSRQAAQLAEQERVFTFKPRVSVRSERIAQRLTSTFMSRQQRHVERRQQLMEHPPFTMNVKRQPRTLPRTFSVSQMHSVSVQLSPDNPGFSKSLCDVSSQDVTSLSGTALTPVESAIDFNEKELRERLAVQETGDQKKESRTISSSRDKLVPIERSPYLSSVISRRKSSDGERNSKHRRHVTCPIIPSQSKGEIVPSLKHTDTAARPRTKSTSAFQKWPNQEIQTHKAGQKSSPTSVTKHPENIGHSQVKRARDAAAIAIRDKKVFLCLGPYSPIRQSLRRRGWVEKNYKGPLGVLKPKKKDKRKNNKQSKLISKLYGGTTIESLSDQSTSSDSDSDAEMADQLVQAYREEFGDDGEYSMTSRAVRLTYPHFVWTCKRDDIEFRFLRRDQIVSHYQQAVSFTTKVGLCKNLRNLVWFTDTNPDTFFPRCYRLCADEEKKTFIDDFRLTAAVNILKWFVENPSRRVYHREQSAGRHQMEREGNKRSDLPCVVPGRAVSLAFNACEDFIAFQEHDDIDVPLSTPGAVSDNDWNDLIQFSYQLTQEQSVLEAPALNHNTISQLLDKLKLHLPQFDLDGLRNIWIIKPGAKSRGRGIFCLDRLEPILDLVSSSVQKKESKLIVQKYIERPFLIYDTKFDIRQWFLVTDWNPLTLWVYKKCYLRFSTQLFTLDSLDQSVHLCNNSIQKHYENAARATELPEENMWDNAQFKEFLAAFGAGNVWDDVIYPGMKEALVSVLLTTQDDMDLRKNAFELFGADFMITEDYRPWLIEINSSPAMSASSTVTAELCPQVMEDTLKVVLDRRHDKTADVGFFELAYKQTHVAVPTYVGMQLVVEGQQVDVKFVNRQVQKRLFKPDSHVKARPQSSLSGYSRCVSSESSDDSETEDSQLTKEGPSHHATACCPIRHVSPRIQDVPKQRIPLKRESIKRTLAVSLSRRPLSLKSCRSGLAVFGARAGNDSGSNADSNFNK